MTRSNAKPFQPVRLTEFRKLYSDTMAADKQEKVMEDFLRQYFEDVIRSRARIAEPNAHDLIGFVESLQQPTAPVADSRLEG